MCIFLFRNTMQAVGPTYIIVLLIWITLVVLAELWVFSCSLLYWLPRIILYKAETKSGIEGTRNRKLLIV